MHPFILDIARPILTCQEYFIVRPLFILSTLVTSSPIIFPGGYLPDIVSNFFTVTFVVSYYVCLRYQLIFVRCGNLKLFCWLLVAREEFIECSLPSCVSTSTLTAKLVHSRKLINEKIDYNKNSVFRPASPRRGTSTACHDKKLAGNTNGRRGYQSRENQTWSISALLFHFSLNIHSIYSLCTWCNVSRTNTKCLRFDWGVEPAMCCRVRPLTTWYEIE